MRLSCRAAGVRREGGGPRPLTDRDASLLVDPERALLWSSKSLVKPCRGAA